MSCADLVNAVVPGSVALPGIPLTSCAVIVVGTPVAVPEIVSTTVVVLEAGNCRTGKVLTLDTINDPVKTMEYAVLPLPALPTSRLPEM